MILNCLIVDDEPLALDLLEAYIKRTPFLALTGRCSSAIEAIQLLKTESVDILFLDIQMPDLTGLELSRMVDEQIKIIFTTAFEQYALEGFRADALDYLLKPISYAEFLKAADKALRWFEMCHTPQNIVEKFKQIIFVKTEHKLLKIKLDQICYIEGLKDYVKFYLEGQVLPIVSLLNMKLLEETLPDSVFIRVHRSYIVNLNKVMLIERGRIVFGKTYIPISDSYKERFMGLIMKNTLIGKSI